MNPLLKGFCAATRPPERISAWEWCANNVEVDATSPWPGKWDPDRFPPAKEILEEFSKNTVHDICCKCSAQASKTQTCLCCACWAIAQAPGPALWVMAAKDEVEEFVRDRASPQFNNCKPVRDKIILEGARNFEFAGMPLYFVGAGSKSKLQSKPIRWLFLDEVRNYPRGALSMVLKRTRAYWNTRRFILSTPDTAGDPVDLAYKQGDQRVWHIHCPSCHQLQPLKFEQLKWTKNETTKTAAGWNFDALAETIRFECVACGHGIVDKPSIRRSLSQNGKFVRTNPNAPKDKVSFHWNALCPQWVPWRSIVEEFLNARIAARHGDLSALKTFINETLGESWDDSLGIIEDFSFFENRKQDYEFGDAWPEETVRFMAADKQAAGGEHYWWVVRAFGRFGKSRLVGHGRCTSFLELEELRKAYNVQTQNACIDSGFNANEVYRFCSGSGWKAMKGDQAEYFLEKSEAGKTFRRCWQITRARPEGERIAGHRIWVKLYRFSSSWMKDILAEFYTGLVGEWTIPRKVGRDYLQMMSADVREERESSNGQKFWIWRQAKPQNHYKDCEEMIHCAAFASGTIAPPKPK